MVPQLDNLKKVIKQFQNFLDEVEVPETSENIDFILKRLKNAMFCLVYGKDQSNTSISRSVVGEFILKTWRISREPEILRSVLEHLPQKLELYNTLCDKILNFANVYLGSRFRELYRIEEYSTIIIKYLLETSISFNQITQMEIVSDYKKNMNLIAESMEELAFMVYNGINDHTGSIIPFSHISKSIKKIWKRIRNVNWKQMLSPGMRFKAHELEKICARFGAVLYPYLEKAAHDTREIGGMIPDTTMEAQQGDIIPAGIVDETIVEEVIINEPDDMPSEEIEEIIEEVIETEPEPLPPVEESPINETALLTPDEVMIPEPAKDVSPPVEAVMPDEPEVISTPSPEEQSSQPKGRKKLLKKSKTPIHERIASRKTKTSGKKESAPETPETTREETPTKPEKVQKTPPPVISRQEPKSQAEEKKPQPAKGFNIKPKKFNKLPSGTIPGRKPVLDTQVKTDKKGKPKFGPIKISTFSLKNADFLKKGAVTQKLSALNKEKPVEKASPSKFDSGASTNIINKKDVKSGKLKPNKTQFLSIKGLLDQHKIASGKETTKMKPKAEPQPPKSKKLPPLASAPEKKEEKESPQTLGKLADELDELLPFGGSRKKSGQTKSTPKIDVGKPSKKSRTTFLRPPVTTKPEPKEPVSQPVQPPPIPSGSLHAGTAESENYSLPSEYKEYQNKLLSSIKEAFRKDREESDDRVFQDETAAKSASKASASGKKAESPIKNQRKLRDSSSAESPLKPLKTSMLPRLKKLSPGIPPSNAFRSPSDRKQKQPVSSHETGNTGKFSKGLRKQPKPPVQEEKPVEEVPLPPPVNEEEILTNYPVILKGNIKFESPVKKIPRRDGRFYFKDLRVVCRFPEIYSQVTFRGPNFVATGEGDFSIKAFLSGFTLENAPTKVKLQFYHNGFKKFSTDFIKISGSPPKANINNIFLERDK